MSLCMHKNRRFSILHSPYRGSPWGLSSLVRDRESPSPVPQLGYCPYRGLSSYPAGATQSFLLHTLTFSIDHIAFCIYKSIIVDCRSRMYSCTSPVSSFQIGGCGLSLSVVRGARSETHMSLVRITYNTFSLASLKIGVCVYTFE